MDEKKTRDRGELPQNPWTHDYADVAQPGFGPSSLEAGLSEAEAARRLRQYGPNRLKQKQNESPWAILVRQFKSVIMVVLAAAAGASFALGEVVDGIAVVVAMLINAAIGFFTELRAVRSMEALEELDVKYCRVLRDGGLQDLAADKVVPGDIVDVGAGDIVPADVRIGEANGLLADESPLTGESEAVRKSVEPVDKDAPIAERNNMLYKGTAIVEGSGRGIVVATGMATEIGEVASMVQEAESGQDPLEKRLDKLGSSLVWFIVAVALVTGVVGVLAGKEIPFMVKTAIALFVAAVPEGLPIVATLALARGMGQMVKRNALVRRLSAVETLGSTTVILTDKTGTLTENRMTATALYVLGGDAETPTDATEAQTDAPQRQPDAPDAPDLPPPNRDAAGLVKVAFDDAAARRPLEVGALCNNAELGEDADVGDPMEVALLRVAADFGSEAEDLLSAQPEVREVAFDPELKMMATYHRVEAGYRLAVKGAPEAVVPKCTSFGAGNPASGGATGGTEVSARTIEGDRAAAMTEKILGKSRRLASEGYRVLALAERRVPRGAAVEADEPYHDLEFLGLIVLEDPPRADVADAVAECTDAGVRVVMVTGDQAETAAAVGQAVGISAADEKARMGRDLDEADDDSHRRELIETAIFSRVSPEQKLSLIKLHQDAGGIVAMTGDGINDAPALKQADIGVAMGQRGEPVAEDAADIILQDDRFATIPVAIRYGRVIFRNIRRFVMYMISGNIGEILVVMVAALAGLPLPLLPLQILYINAINDIFPALALGVGAGSQEVMRRPPRDPAEPIMARRHWVSLVLYGLVIAAAVFACFLVALGPLGLSEQHAVTISFLSVAFVRLLHVFNMRDARSGVFKNDVVRNPFVWGALGLCTVLLVLAVYLPPVALVLGVVDPGVTGWTMILATAAVPLLVGQIGKAVARQRRTGP